MHIIYGILVRIWSRLCFFCARRMCYYANKCFEINGDTRRISLYLDKNGKWHIDTLSIDEPASTSEA